MCNARRFAGQLVLLTYSALYQFCFGMVHGSLQQYGPGLHGATMSDSGRMPSRRESVNGGYTNGHTNGHAHIEPLVCSNGAPTTGSADVSGSPTAGAAAAHAGLHASGRRHDAAGSLHGTHEGGHGSLAMTTSREGVLLSTSSSLAPRAHHARKLSISSTAALHTGHNLQQAGSGSLDGVLAAAAAATGTTVVTTNGHATSGRPSMNGANGIPYGSSTHSSNGHAVHDTQHSSTPCLPDSQGLGSMAQGCFRLLLGYSSSNKTASQMTASAGWHRTCSLLRLLILAPVKIPAWLSHCLIFRPLALLTLCLVSASPAC
jgi:hypothetical protein